MNKGIRQFHMKMPQEVMRTIIMAPQITRSAFQGGSAAKLNAANPEASVQGAKYIPSAASRIPEIQGNIPNFSKDTVDIGKDNGSYDYSQADAVRRLAFHTGESKPIDRELLVKLDPLAAELTGGEGTGEVDFMWSRYDLAARANNTAQISESIDYMASRYAALKTQIIETVPAAYQKSQLNYLDGIMDKVTERLAQQFSDKIGGVYEENGVSGEKEKIYQSVLLEIKDKTAAYETFAKENPSTLSTDKIWLKKDSAYMANELRKAFHCEPSSKTTITENRYTSKELQQLGDFASEIKSYTESSMWNTKGIHIGNESEESLGIKLAELSLKGMVAANSAELSDVVKAVVQKGIEGVISNSITNTKNYMETISKMQIDAQNHLVSAKHGITREEADKNIAAIKKNFTALDEDAIYQIINRVTAAYQETGNAGKALINGAIFAEGAYMEKMQKEQYNGIGRYDTGDDYWNNFFVKQYSSENKYAKNQSGLDTITNAWNNFMEKITTNQDAFLTIFQFSAIS